MTKMSENSKTDVPDVGRLEWDHVLSDLSEESPLELSSGLELGGDLLFFDFRVWRLFWEDESLS
jgi:hypothetical protein